MYRLHNGDIIDTAGGTLLSRAEDIDSALFHLYEPNHPRTGRLVLIIWEADIAFIVASPEDAEGLLQQYRTGQLRHFYADEDLPE